MSDTHRRIRFVEATCIGCAASLVLFIVLADNVTA